MNPRERGFLLLTSRLGNPDRQVLSTAQLRMLALRMRGRECAQPEREMTRQDFIELGYDRETAERYCALLSDTQELDYYLSRGRKMDCNPVTRVSEDYPGILRQRLVMDAPGCLWGEGRFVHSEHPGGCAGGKPGAAGGEQGICRGGGIPGGGGRLDAGFRQRPGC